MFLTIESFWPLAEAFLLFSQSIPSHNELGIIDPKSSTIELTVNGRDLTVTQSPSVLSSNRAGGTTGAGMYAPTPATIVASKEMSLDIRTC